MNATTQLEKANVKAQKVYGLGNWQPSSVQEKVQRSLCRSQAGPKRRTRRYDLDYRETDSSESGSGVATLGEHSYMYSDELSDVLRQELQPMERFRQFCDAKDAASKGLNKGDKFYWNIYGNVATQGTDLAEQDTMPETNFTITQNSLTIGEMGNSVFLSAAI